MHIHVVNTWPGGPDLGWLQVNTQASCEHRCADDVDARLRLNVHLLARALDKNELGVVFFFADTSALFVQH